MFRNKIIQLTTFVSILFFIAIAFDITPFLRGPANYPPDWRWQYKFVNTFSRILLPLVICCLILFLFKFSETKQKLFARKEKRLLVLLVFLSIVFQFAVLFFSRSGVNVLVHRIINPELNGYFTTATQIIDIPTFLRGFGQNVLKFSMHAQGHPPGAVLFFWVINQTFSFIPFFNQLSMNFVPSHQDVRLVWETLKPFEKSGAIFIAFFIPFLSSLTLIPLYYCSKLLFGAKTAVRAVFLYIFIPSVVLFVPINDVFLPIFTISALLFLARGFKSQTKYNFLVSGIIFSTGLFFSLSLVPLGLMFLLLLFFYSNRKQIIQSFIFPLLLFALGFLLLPLNLLILFNFNFFTVGQTLMSGLPKFRAYQIWVFYNLYDFFIFCGIPILVLFIHFLFSQFQTKFKPLSKELVSFTVMLLLLDFSGAVRGEVGRIWIPFVPIVVLLIAFFTAKDLKLSTRQFILILVLQALQVLLMQEFWVMLS